MKERSEIMDVLFLDFDGVINNTSSREFITLPMVTRDGSVMYNTYWASQCIAPFLKLMRFCKAESIQLVISSTWRIGQNTKVFNDYFDTYFRRENKVPRVVGITNISPSRHRGQEITEFIESNDVDNYIVLDDEIEHILEYIPDENIVKIDNSIGIVEKDVDKIVYMWYNIIKKKQRS